MTINSKEYLNQQEQICKNANDIAELKNKNTYLYSLSFADVSDEEWEFETSFYSTDPNIAVESIDDIKQLIYNKIGSKFRLANSRDIFGMLFNSDLDTDTYVRARVYYLDDTYTLVINGTTISSISHIVLNKITI